MSKKQKPGGLADVNDKSVLIGDDVTVLIEDPS